ncbi:hypothetical protein [Duganella sp. BJB1802]|uniref:hypothetical protein n=1 Tax=Duganella sp. BJB1802 TaxID=2744575 RepID=UPI001E5D29B1|nr:hypothetical protein [Duganella sp. BJB1802]
MIGTHRQDSMGGPAGQAARLGGRDRLPVLDQHALAGLDHAAAQALAVAQRRDDGAVGVREMQHAAVALEQRGVGDVAMEQAAQLLAGAAAIQVVRARERRKPGSLTHRVDRRQLGVALAGLAVLALGLAALELGQRLLPQRVVGAAGHLALERLALRRQLPVRSR